VGDVVEDIRTVFEKRNDTVIYILTFIRNNIETKQFDEWNGTKKTVNDQTGRLYAERAIWWCLLGVNMGFEQDGTGKSFERPVVVLQGFSKMVCLVVPLTTATKENKSHSPFGRTSLRKCTRMG
jgi:hypothetical protein